MVAFIQQAGSKTKEPLNFFQMLYSLARLSPETARFLTEKKTVGRLLSLFHTGPANQELFNDSKLLVFREMVMEEFPLPNSKSYTASCYDQLNRNIDHQQFDCIKNTYLWATVGYLGRLFRIKDTPTRSPLQLFTFDLTPTKEEATLIFPISQYLTKALSDATCARASYYNLAKLLAHWCYEDPKNTSELLKALVAKEALPSKEKSEMRAFLRVFMEFLSLEDSLQTQRVNPNSFQC
jgi:hypothetical protein